MGPTVVLSRLRPRRARIRREPIDLELLAAELGEPAVETSPTSMSEQEILRALEVEVERVKAARVIATTPVVVPVQPPVAEVETPVEVPVFEVPVAEIEVPVAVPVFEAPVAADPFGIVEVDPTPRPATNVGLPLDQVQAWLDQVEEDLRKVEARVEYLQAEQSRLQSQHQLVAELISSSTPV